MAEKEYIEREAALNAIKNEIDNYQPNPDPYSITPYEFVRRGLNIAYSIIKNQPTADVQEVKHGKWIEDDNGVQTCSECGEEHEWQDYRASYCEDCGAKMDKE